MGSVVEQRVGVVKHWQYNESNFSVACTIGLIHGK